MKTGYFKIPEHATIEKKKTIKTFIYQLNYKETTENSSYDLHLDMKLDNAISKSFQEMSLSDFEILHDLCDLEGRNRDTLIASTSSFKRSLCRTLLPRKSLKFD